jgi:hypothetical protein
MNIRIFTEENQGNEVGKELVYPANLLATRSGAFALPCRSLAPQN